MSRVANQFGRKDRDDLMGAANVKLADPATWKDYDPSKPVDVWVASVARNAMRDELRKEKRQAGREEPLDEGQEPAAEDREPEIEREELSQELQAAIGELEDSRVKSVMTALATDTEGKTDKELAAKLGLSQKAFATAKQKGYSQVSAIMEGRVFPREGESDERGTEEGEGAVGVDLPEIQETGVRGSAASLETADGASHPVAYLAVEAESIIPSHDARRNFAKNPLGDENERPYHDPVQGRSSRELVEAIAAAKGNLQLLTSNNPTPQDGPPMVDPFGVVLGGNARSMGMQLAYHKGGEAADAIKKAMVAAAPSLGIDAASIASMNQPVIVRVLTGVSDRGAMSRLLNESLMAGRSQAVSAVAQGKKVSATTATKVSAMLEPDAEGKTPTLRQVMADPKKANRITELLLKDGAWTPAEVDKFTDPATAELNEDGKTAIEQLLVGRIVGDPSLIGKATKGVRQRLLTAIGPLVRGLSDETHGTKFGEIVRTAVEAFREYKASGVPLRQYFMQQKSMVPFAGQGDAAVAAMVNALDTLGPRQFQGAIENIIRSLDIDTGGKQGVLFGGTEKASTVDEAIKIELGDVKEKGDRKDDVDAMRGGPVGHASTHGMPVSMEGTGQRLGASEVIDKLSDLFETPIRFGRLMGRGLRGVYKKIWQNARLKGKESASIDVTTHELAHGLDRKTDVTESISPEAEVELNALDYEDKGRKAEGFAEFMRAYLTEDFDAQEAAPHYHEEFRKWLDANPKWKDRIAKAKTLVDQWRQAGAEGRVLGQVSKTGKPPRLPIRKLIPHWLRQGYQKLKEQAHYGYIFEKELRRMGYNPGKGASFMDLYKAFTQGGPVLANTALESGVFTLGTNGTIERIGPSLWKGLSVIPEAEYDTWVAWAYARHAMESWSQGKNPGVTREDAKYVYEKYKDREHFVKAADALTEFNNNLLEVLVDSGVITAESAERMMEAYETYLPLHRVLPRDVKPGGSLKGARLVDLPSPIKARRGSGYQIIDPVQATVARAIQFYERAAAQVVMDRMIKAAWKHGANGWVEQLQPKLQQFQAHFGEVWPGIRETMIKSGMSEAEVEVIEESLDDYDDTWKADFVNIYRPNWAPDRSGQPVARVVLDGRPTLFYFNKDLYETINGMGYYQLPKALDETFGRLTRMVRAGATTLNPTFIATNFMRDMPVYLTQRNYGGQLDPGTAVISYAYSEFMRRVGKEGDPHVKLWRQHGGQLSSVLGPDRRSVRRAVASAVAGKQKFGVMESILDAVQVTEAGPRLAEFKGVFKKHGYSTDDVRKMVQSGNVPRKVLVEALNAAHEVTVDFRRMGQWGRWMTRMIPFFNANLEGVDKSIRTWKDNPTRTFARYIAYTVIPAIAYWWVHKDEPWYEEKEDWLDAFWVITDETGRAIARIPRGHELATVGSGVEAILNAFYREDPKALKNWLKAAVHRTGPDLDVAGAGTALEIYSNKDLFRQQKIVPEYLEDAKPHLQTKKYTTGTMKVIAGWLNVSPAKLEHMAEGLTGGMYRRVTAPVEKWWRNDPLDPSDIPVQQGFVLRKQYTRSMREFYEQAKETRIEYRSLGLEDKTVPKSLQRQHYRLERGRDVLAALRKASDAATTKDAKWEFERHMVGVARMMLGKDEVDIYPNPYTATDLPKAIKAVVDDDLTRAAYTVAKPDKLVNPTTKATVDNSVEYLRSIAAPQKTLVNLLTKRMLEDKLGDETRTSWRRRLRRRLTKGVE